MKVVFEIDQWVLVKPVGTRAQIVRVVPVWSVCDPAPIQVFYDCGLGRLFDQSELELVVQDAT